MSVYSDDDHKRLSVEEDLPFNISCRICHGEATDDNPLFHPCRCKGSIKYIHESCLMEWTASKHIDINEPGSTVSCDICHYPINFTTMYDEGMPEKVPIGIFLRKTFRRLLDSSSVALVIVLAVVMYCIGLPLAWNFIGKGYTMMLDKSLPYPGEFWRSMIFGYSDISDTLTTISVNNVLPQLLANYKFSVLQILLNVILIVGLYFQYDMIVREEVFSKMVVHKIGARLIMDEFKARLEERLPGVNEEMIEHLERAIRARELANNRDDQNLFRHNNDEEPLGRNHEPRRNIPPTEPIIPELNDLSDINNNEDSDPNFEPSHGTDVSSSSSALSADEEESQSSNGLTTDESDDYEGANTAVNENHQQIRNGPGTGIPSNRRNTYHEFDQNETQRDIGQRNQLGEQPAPPIREQAVEAGAIEPNIEAEEAVGPLMFHIQLKFSTVVLYFVIALSVVTAYQFLCYAIPTFLGYGLLKLYFGIGKIFARGILQILNLIKVTNTYRKITLRYEIAAKLNDIIIRYIVEPSADLYVNYVDNNLESSMIARSIPSLVTYSTIITVITIWSELMSKGYGKRNPMTKVTRRAIFQILFALRCTFKVFALFFIELAGFPILAGGMLDFALLCPILKSQDSLLWVPKFCAFWTPSMFMVYWTVGTLYMYWFAKYISMIRKNIIRPGVLFFIRSPEDPNIKILHDSLIHPMSIQLSRLCLSMFIYAVFIIVGFGFHTRFMFPYIFSTNFLSVPHYLKPQSPFSLQFISLIIIFLLGKIALEADPYVNLYVKYYWMFIFKVGCQKLRLSSFMLGKDYATETGHILYRNTRYRIFASKRARWSNPELFSRPKTVSQAVNEFSRNQNIHAYFIPDGTLMRVPSSDIISRSYVQTMFVPVTRDDKLLKPLDLERINEHNKRTSGEFGYLDEQNTEFDDYFVVYVPPNFRFRYMTLIFLMWSCASILIISTAIVSQYFLSFQISIALWLYGKVTGTQHLKSTSFLFTRIQPHLACFGTIILSFLNREAIRRYRQALSAINLADGTPVDENTDEMNQESQNNNNEIADDRLAPVIEDILNVNGDNIRDAILESFTFKLLMNLIFQLISISLSGVSIAFIWTNAIDSWNTMISLITNNKSLLLVLPKLVKSWEVLEWRDYLLLYHFMVNSLWTNWILLQKKFLAHRNESSKSLFIMQASYLLSLYWQFFVFATLPIEVVNYTSQNLRFDINHSHSQLDKIFAFAKPAILIVYILARQIPKLRNWLIYAHQRVKDEMYSRGKILQNFSE